MFLIINHLKRREVMNKVLASMLAGMVLISSTFAFAEDVYATKNGKRYHKADCLLIKEKGAKAISLEDATKKGLKPCRRCFGETDSAKKEKADLLAKAEASGAPNNALVVPATK
jgi:hypothetical protein